MGLLDNMNREIEERKQAIKEQQQRDIEELKAMEDAKKDAEAKVAKVSTIVKKCGDNGKALVTAEAKKVDDIDDMELAKETVKISTAKVIEAERKCVAMEVATKELDSEGAFVMEPLLDADDVELMNEVFGAKAAKTTKARTKGGPTKEELVFDAIKGGNNTKKGLEADSAGFGGDVHGQTFTLTKKGLIKSVGSGVYAVV